MIAMWMSSPAVCPLTQVVDSLIDQRLHGPLASTSGTTSDIVQEVMQEHSVFPIVPGTCPQARCDTLNHPNLLGAWLYSVSCHWLSYADL